MNFKKIPQFEACRGQHQLYTYLCENLPSRAPSAALTPLPCRSPPSCRAATGAPGPRTITGSAINKNTRAERRYRLRSVPGRRRLRSKGPSPGAGAGRATAGDRRHRPPPLPGWARSRRGEGRGGSRRPPAPPARLHGSAAGSSPPHRATPQPGRPLLRRAAPPTRPGLRAPPPAPGGGPPPPATRRPLGLPSPAPPPGAAPPARLPLPLPAGPYPHRCPAARPPGPRGGAGPDAISWAPVAMVRARRPPPTPRRVPPAAGPGGSAAAPSRSAAAPLHTAAVPGPAPAAALPWAAPARPNAELRPGPASAPRCRLSPSAATAGAGTWPEPPLPPPNRLPRPLLLAIVGTNGHLAPKSELRGREKHRESYAKSRLYGFTATLSCSWGAVEMENNRRKFGTGIDLPTRPCSSASLPFTERKSKCWLRLLHINKHGLWVFFGFGSLGLFKDRLSGAEVELQSYGKASATFRLCPSLHCYLKQGNAGIKWQNTRHHFILMASSLLTNLSNPRGYSPSRGLTSRHHFEFITNEDR